MSNSGEPGASANALPTAGVDASIEQTGFVLRLKRIRTELRAGKQFARTVSRYEAFYNRQKLAGLEGVAFERQGPGDNASGGSKYHRRIAAGTYPLLAQDGSNYRTIGYQTNGEHPRPALLVGETGQRVAILVHPGSGYLSSIGCINLSRPLGGADDDIGYGESQLCVTAIINAMRMELGAGFPLRNGRRITDAWLVIEGEPPNVEPSGHGVARGILRNDPRERDLYPPANSLPRGEIYELFAATMRGDRLAEHASLPLFERLCAEVKDIGSLRDEFGRNLWCAWATGWQAAARLSGAERSRLQADLRQTAQRLRAAGVDINDAWGLTTPLIDAAKANEWEAVRALYALGADLNARDRRGDTPLTAAALHGRREAVAWLIALGADREASVGVGTVPQSAPEAIEGLSLEVPVACPPGSAVRQCTERGMALHDTNEARRKDYAGVVAAIDQVSLGRVCHIWDYKSRSCKQTAEVWQVRDGPAVHFLSKLQVDADGAPRAYHPLDRNPPANTGKAFDWLANLSGSDQHGTQGEGGALGPAPGFIISATSLTDSRFAVNDTRRYVDASTIPYVVLPKATLPLPSGMVLKAGCVACVIDTHTGGFSGAIFADIGRAVGEGSIRLAQRLGLSPFSSRHWPKVIGFSDGHDDRRFFYIVFPNAAIAPPWPVEVIQKVADALFAEWGGVERLSAILPGLPALKPPVSVFAEEPPAAARGADDEPPPQGRLRGLDGPKERFEQEEPTGAEPAALSEGAAGADRGPAAGKFEPDPREGQVARGVSDVHPDERDGPSDLPAEAEARVALPQVSWPSADSEAPCYAHLVAPGEATPTGNVPFDFGGEDLSLLCAANAFSPEGYGDRIVFALRGTMLQQGDSVRNVATVALVETRPDHRAFRCVIGVFDRRAGTISAFKASTVPNAAYMTNYYKKVHGIQPYGETGANLLPTGCYVFRVGTHRNSIYPALRLTDPEKLGEDGKAVVLRTSNDLSYRLDDVWDPCIPYDHVHCAYSYEAFSSAGCLTICGPDHAGPWGQFQDILKTVPRGNRLDLVLLTGREARLAARFRGDSRGPEDHDAQSALARLRPGSQGDRVRRLQSLLGLEASGYFGWRTKQALIERQRKSGLGRDGIYAPALDAQLGWDVFPSAPTETSQVAARSAGRVRASSVITPTLEELRRFAPGAGEDYLRIFTSDGLAELAYFGINHNPLRFCHFMAQVGHECAGFSILCESLKYRTVGQLRAVWPSRFPDDASARPYLGNEQMLAEKVYGGRLGNTQTGDAFRYRGRGFLQTTGREAYRELGTKLQLPLEDTPDLLLEPAVALRVACRTWADKVLPGERSMNVLADLNKIAALTYRINGGHAGVDGRRAEFAKAWRIWGDGEPPTGSAEPEVIERGDRGEQVAKLTHALHELGYYQDDGDQVFGARVYASVRRFQEGQGLQLNGVVGRETRDAIDRALSGRAAGLRRMRPRSGQARRREARLFELIRRAATALTLLLAGCIAVILAVRATGTELSSFLLWLPLLVAGLVLSALFGLWVATHYLSQARPDDVTGMPADAGVKQQLEGVRSGTGLASAPAARGSAEDV